ncbi:hypothetical protein BDR07DRAFT_1497864 [Suillus spraguei]|nr:hypothetical protein BDR07DRAFT_1497864 [Suillus spraguei]
MSVKVPFFIKCISFSPIAVNNAVSTAPKELTFIYHGTPEFEQAARLMADECLLSYYNGVYYNLPDKQLLFYVIRGSHIGVVAGWENTLNCVLGVNKPEYHDVVSIVLGEQLVREAIDKGQVEMVDSWGSDS